MKLLFFEHIEFYHKTVFHSKILKLYAFLELKMILIIFAFFILYIPLNAEDMQLDRLTLFHDGEQESFYFDKKFSEEKFAEIRRIAKEDGEVEHGEESLNDVLLKAERRRIRSLLCPESLLNVTRVSRRFTSIGLTSKKFRGRQKK